MAWLAWTGFIASTVVLVLISRKQVPLALLVAASILGAFTLPVPSMVDALLSACLDPGNICLGVGMALIPVIGVIMEDSGHLEALVENARMSRAAFNVLAPALVGLLPVPGGALISAPLVNKTAGDGVAPARKCASNVWFRHVLFLIYPVSAALLVSAAVAGVNVYVAILHLIPFFGASLVAGYWFFLRGMPGRLEPAASTSRRKAIEAFTILATTPAVDITLRALFPVLGIDMENLSLVIATGISVALAWCWGRHGAAPAPARATIVKAKPWNFYLFIIFMFFYLNVFIASGLTTIIAGYSLDKFTLLVGTGFALGFITGRVQVPETIVIPIFLATFSLVSMSPLAFATGYFAVHLGYLNSPIHPCLSVTLSYFGTTFTATVRRLLPPTSFCLGLVLLMAILV